jgi:hypothetical protein
MNKNLNNESVSMDHSFYIPNTSSIYNYNESLFYKEKAQNLSKDNYTYEFENEQYITIKEFLVKLKESFLDFCNNINIVKMKVIKENNLQKIKFSKDNKLKEIKSKILELRKTIDNIKS